MPADNVALGRNQVSNRQHTVAFRLRPEPLDSARELVANGERRLQPSAGPRVPLPNMEIGTTDSGGVNANQDVTGAAAGDGCFQ